VPNPPSPERVAKHALWLGLARASFGAPAALDPERTVRMLGARRSTHASPARFVAGFFGVRELLLGVFMVAGRRDARRLRPVVAFAALADLGDTVLLLRDAVARKRLEARAAMFLTSAALGSAASIALWREVAQLTDS
jgi:hypothetical protein